MPRNRTSCIGLALLTVAVPATADVPIAGTDIYPESMSADATGRLYIGSVKGTVFRSGPNAVGPAQPWIRRDAKNGLLSILGVLVDETHRTVWLCSSPFPLISPPTVGISSVMAFDLRSGAFKASYPFPAPAAACNDIAVAKDGTLYATDTPNGRIMRLRPGGKALEPFVEDKSLIGLDGIAFAADGTLYANNVRQQKMLRINRNRDGSYAGVTELSLSQPVGGPDGLRPIAGNRFVQAEGQSGRITEVTINGDHADIRVLKDGLRGSVATVYSRGSAYTIEGKIGYLLDPKLKGQDPGPFVALAIPLETGR